MGEVEGFFKFLFSTGYCTFISSDPIYEKIVEKIGGAFILTVNSKCSCGIAVGLKLAGVRSIVLEEDTYAFIHTCLTLCAQYSTHIAAATISDINKIKDIACITLVGGYENKLKRRLREVDNNTNSLLLGLGGWYAKEGSS